MGLHPHNEALTMSREFFDAIKRGKIDEVKQLLSLNPSLIHEKDEYLSPIMVAVYNHQLKIVEFLNEKVGNLNIFEASATGKTNQVIRLIARDPQIIHAYSCDGFQPLGLSCFFGHYETAAYLIRVGAAINSPSQNSLCVTPIQSATAAGHTDIVQLLLSHNANPNVRGRNGETPLHTAAQTGDAPTIRILLFNGADMSLRCHQGKLPLDLAMEAGHAEATALFKEGITRRFKAMVVKN
jgi:ankyrin repeat protein